MCDKQVGSEPPKRAYAGEAEADIVMSLETLDP